MKHITSLANIYERPTAELLDIHPIKYLICTSGGRNDYEQEDW